MIKKALGLFSVALLIMHGYGYGGSTGLGTDPFATGGAFTSAQANAMNNAINDNATDIGDLTTLSGVAANATHLGTFTGSTISDSVTIKEALQELETEVESAGGGTIGTTGVVNADEIAVFSDATTLKALTEAEFKTAYNMEAGTDYQGVLAEGAFANGDKTKLDGIEALADVTDATNVAAAGALMTSSLGANVETFLGTPTLANLNSAVSDATLLDDGAIGDSTAIGLTTGDNYTNFGVVTDDSLNEMFAAIDTAIGGLGGTPALSALSNMAAPKAFDNTSYTLSFTNAITASDGYAFINTAAIGDVSVFRIEHNTGNATNGTLLELVQTDTDIDPIDVKVGGGSVFNLSSAGVLTLPAGGGLVVTPNSTAAQYSDYYEDTDDGGNYHRLQGQAFAANRTSLLPDYNVGFLASAQVDSGGDLADGAVDPAHLADADFGPFTMSSGVGSMDANSIDSDQYVDGSIDPEHLAAGSFYTATASKTGAYTIGTDDAKESYGGVIYVSSAATMTLPAVASGMSVSVITIGAVAVSVDTNASDRMYLDGVALDDGDKATNTSTTGDMLVCTYESVAGWYCASGSPDGDHWTDGGP